MKLKYKMGGVFLALFITALSGFAQNTKAIDWQPYYNDGKVAIEFKYSECKSPNSDIVQEYVFLKVQNLTADAQVLKFQQELTYGTKCINCTAKNPEYEFTVFLQPNEILEADCKNNNTAGIKIFSRFLAPQVVVASVKQGALSNFKLKEVSLSLNK